MKRFVKILSSAVLLAAMSNVFAVGTVCPSTSDLHDDIGFQYASITSDGSWEFISNTVTYNKKAWNVKLNINLPGVTSPTVAVQKANEWIMFLPLATPTTDNNGLCNYTPPGAVYAVFAKSPPYEARAHG